MTDKTAAQAIIDDTPDLNIDRNDLRALRETVRLALKVHSNAAAKAQKIDSLEQQIILIQAQIDNLNGMP